MVSTIWDALPPILTQTALVLGAPVPVTRYGLTGTPDFGESVLEVLDAHGLAVILRNHGLIAFGWDFDAALVVAEIVEVAAKVSVHGLAANGGQEPHLVPEDLIPGMQERFLTTYGQPA